MANERIYTYVSGKAARGLQRIAKGRDVYIRESPSGKGYTVVTKDAKDAKPRPRVLERA